jgi:hypothetical protein
MEISENFLSDVVMASVKTLSEMKNFGAGKNNPEK